MIFRRILCLFVGHTFVDLKKVTLVEHDYLDGDREISWTNQKCVKCGFRNGKPDDYYASL